MINPEILWNCGNGFGKWKHFQKGKIGIANESQKDKRADYQLLQPGAGTFRNRLCSAIRAI